MTIFHAVKSGSRVLLQAKARNLTRKFVYMRGFSQRQSLHTHVSRLQPRLNARFEEANSHPEAMKDSEVSRNEIVYYNFSSALPSENIERLGSQHSMR